MIADNARCESYGKSNQRMNRRVTRHVIVPAIVAFVQQGRCMRRFINSYYIYLHLSEILLRNDWVIRAEIMKFAEPEQPWLRLLPSYVRFQFWRQVAAELGVIWTYFVRVGNL